MSGFDDLIADAMPYLATEELSGTAGTTWRWEYVVKDNPGNLLDLSTGYTVTAALCRPDSTTSVVATTVTFPSVGTIRCSATATATGSVAPGIYYHEITIVRTSDSAKIIAVGAGDAKFTVKRKASA